MVGNTPKNRVIVVAILLGLVTSFLIHRYLTSIKTVGESKEVTAVIATCDIPARTVIDPSMVGTRVMRAAQAPEGVCVRKSEVVGQVALTSLSAGTVMSNKDIAAKSASLGLAYIVPAQMRAITVAVDPVIAVAGFLKPGDHVDVLASFSRNDGYSVTRTVLQDVELLALGSVTTAEPDAKGKVEKAAEEKRKSTATLLVDPESAEKLVMADSEGKIRLVLRSSGDVVRADTKGTSNIQFMGVPPSMRRTELPQTRTAEVRVIGPDLRPYFPPQPRPVPSVKLPRLPVPEFTANASEKLPPLGGGPIRGQDIVQTLPEKHEIVVIRGTQIERVALGAEPESN